MSMILTKHSEESVDEELDDEPVKIHIAASA